MRGVVGGGQAMGSGVRGGARGLVLPVAGLVLTVLLCLPQLLRLLQLACLVRLLPVRGSRGRQMETTGLRHRGGRQGWSRYRGRRRGRSLSRGLGWGRDWGRLGGDALPGIHGYGVRAGPRRLEALACDAADACDPVGSSSATTDPTTTDPAADSDPTAADIDPVAQPIPAIPAIPTLGRRWHHRRSRPRVHPGRPLQRTLGCEPRRERPDLVEDLDQLVVGARLRQQLRGCGKRLACPRGGAEAGLRVGSGCSSIATTCHSASGMPLGAPGVPCSAKYCTRALESGLAPPADTAQRVLRRTGRRGSPVRRPSSARARDNRACPPRGWSPSGGPRPAASRCRSRRDAGAGDRCRWLRGAGSRA